MNWTPVLEHAARARAEQIIEHLATQLSLDDFADEPPGLASGRPGLAMFHTYLAMAWPEADWSARARDTLEQALSSPSEAGIGSDSSLLTGFPGVMWLLEHMPAPREAASVLENAEHAIASAVEVERWDQPFYYAEGLIGLGVFLLERPPSPIRERALARIVHHLERLAVSADGGIAWLRPAESFPEAVRPKAAVFDLGIPRGVSGAIAFLARLMAEPSLRAPAESLLRPAIRWLLKQQHVANDVGRFGSHVLPGEAPPAPARLGWCYGDLGVSVMLLSAARSLNDRELETFAVELALRTMQRPKQSTEIEDAAFCHGACGAGHLYARLFHATGDVGFLNAARGWFQVGISMYRNDAGFSTFYATQESPVFSYRVRPGLLMGSIGIGLCLLSACKPVAPDWDRYFLVHL